jgi:hypothetical protein
MKDHCKKPRLKCNDNLNIGIESGARTREMSDGCAEPNNVSWPVPRQVLSRLFGDGICLTPVIRKHLILLVGHFFCMVFYHNTKIKKRFGLSRNKKMYLSFLKIGTGILVLWRFVTRKFVSDFSIILLTFLISIHCFIWTHIFVSSKLQS